MNSRRILLALFVLLIACCTTILAQPGNENWDSRFGFPGVDGEVKAMAVSGADIYFGGDFKHAGNIPANNVVRWNIATHRWYPLGNFPYGVNGRVHAIAVDGDKVYIGGQFTHVGAMRSTNLAVYTISTNTWSTIGDIGGSMDIVLALVVRSGELFVGGSFTAAGATLAINIASFDGITWKRLGSGTGGPVYAITKLGNDLYVGGAFTTAGATNVANIALWRDTTWFAVGSGANGRIHAIAASATELYVGGMFSRVGNVNASNVARVNLATLGWSALGSGIRQAPLSLVPSVNAITLLDNQLYVGGDFHWAGADSNISRHLAHWDGTQWLSMREPGSTTARGVGSRYLGYSVVNALAAVNGELYIGGRFDNVYMRVKLPGINENDDLDGYNAFNVVRWNPQARIWRTLGDSPNGVVYAMTMSGDHLILGGRFTTAGSIPAMNIARWNRIDRTWALLGDGIGGIYVSVRAIASNGNDIYAAVQAFDSSTTAPSRSYVTHWNGSTWTSLGQPFAQMTIAAIAVSGNVVYAGGVATDTQAASIFRWDGSAWTALGGGVNGSVAALAVDSNNLYVGGTFTMAGSTPAANIARWNGSAWSALGAGTNNAVNAIAVDQRSVYIGGLFTSAGAVAADHIAEWSIFDNAWRTLGSGVNDRVRALAIRSGLVYAAGDFVSAGGITVGHIARWDGESWSRLADAVNDTVFAIAVSEDEVFAGGAFNVAGAWSSFHIGRWSDATASVHHASTITPPATFLTASPNPFTSATSIRFTLSTPSHIRLTITDVLGRERTRLINAPLSPGNHTTEWTAEDLPSGIYLCRLESAGRIVVVKVVKK